ncbi:uncharacterized protein AMSG_11087 [Thecamonas trahens ATCC 50062]|uniref:VASt domain-containing protein n=1 Tax=Thecamonas trahens ATCC 50062 TaxID=461836 RepID=A0A0L0DTN8_THETB|nr:hypothetical protein AMSG_11087 [Thecamonas trahens ATCC 50062]KNC55426.1 hypothetical protein AMSG_11087 [Thecamonas trahens ATCC 50062]|eukprot:XP_013752964.1 hypothetical protein AMSG_11087 [Thecamonas trahens ATCC 50062]
MWTLVFAEGGSFLPSLYAELGHRIESQSPWSHRADDATDVRELVFDQVVKTPMGVKEAHLVEEQVAVVRSVDGGAGPVRFVVATETASTGVPYADYFLVLNRYCCWADPAAPDSACFLFISSEFKWIKSTMLKRVIAKASLARTAEYYGAWLAHLQKMVATAAQPRQSMATSATPVAVAVAAASVAVSVSVSVAIAIAAASGLAPSPASGCS